MWTRRSRLRRLFCNWCRLGSKDCFGKEEMWLLERQPIEMISVCHSALDAESKVETLSTCKRSVAETLFSAKSTLDLSATLRGVALDSVSSTE
jgi:hypothetical protein